MLNGRGYPTRERGLPARHGGIPWARRTAVQCVNALVNATAGNVFSSASRTSATGVRHDRTAGIPMLVVGRERAAPPRRRRVAPYYRRTRSPSGGETADVILDTTGHAGKKYFLYAKNLRFLSNQRRELRAE